MASQEKVEEKSSSSEAIELIDELYKYNQQYFQINDVEKADVKDEEVRKKMEETLQQLSLKEDDLPRPLFQYLRGKALNVLPTYSKEAEILLSQAVKHNPSLVDAWNCLGESYWKQGNVQQAHHCFVGALSHEKNKVSLRNLSMALRQMGKDVSEKHAKIQESLEKAKEAVSLDVKDGMSWMVLGNAYLSSFFSTNQDPKILQQCSNAYSQAEKDTALACNPDLHFNMATLFLYEEQYSTALHHLEQACRFDPSWPTPRQKLSSVKSFLQSFSRLIATRGNLKPKRLSKLYTSLEDQNKWLGKTFIGRRTLSVKNLREFGSKDPSNEVLIGGVTACISTEDRVPVACVLVDSEGDSIGITIYNVSSTCHFSIGDILTVPDLKLTHTHVQDMGVEYDNIRLTQPQKILCNGVPLPQDKLSTSVAQVTTFS